MPQEFYKAIIAYREITKDATLYENPECVKKMINSDYWNAVEMLNKKKKEDNDEDSGKTQLILIIVGAVFVISLILLIIYFRRPKAGSIEKEGNLTVEPVSDE